ncbi:MAG: VCBS repeat-containing protein, partial [Candidatus Latescibacteria bacterium]|nr:VCBS repeat-containing protein [Candidatus Latescibacterota bacterium]
MGSGAAFFDYDDDGDLDLYIVNGAPLSLSGTRPTNVLYRNNGDGTFTDATDKAGVGNSDYGMGCAVADYDNDGDVDLYVTNYGPNRLYRNNGDGTFTDVAAQAGVRDDKWGTSCAFADYDNDGDLDLYVANYVEVSPEKDKSCSDPISNLKFYCHPREFDGQPDVLYRNNGDGTFTDVTRDAGVFNPSGKGLGVVWGDYDNDG